MRALQSLLDILFNATLSHAVLGNPRHNALPIRHVITCECRLPHVTFHFVGQPVRAVFVFSLILCESVSFHINGGKPASGNDHTLYKMTSRMTDLALVHATKLWLVMSDIFLDIITLFMCIYIYICDITSYAV